MRELLVRSMKAGKESLHFADLLRNMKQLAKSPPTSLITQLSPEVSIRNLSDSLLADSSSPGHLRDKSLKCNLLQALGLKSLHIGDLTHL